MPVNRSSIPQQEDMAFEMFENARRKTGHIQTVKIFSAQAEIERQTFLLRGNRKGADGGNPILFVEMIEKRRFASGRPGAGNIRNEQKAGFVDKNQVRAKAFSVFLYAASDNFSNERFPLRFFVKRGAPAFDSSSPSRPGSAKHDRDDSKFQSFARLFWPPALRSKDRFDSRRPAGLSKGHLSTVVSAVCQASAAGRELVWVVSHPSRLSDTPVTSEKRNLPMNPEHEPLPADFCPLLTTVRPAGDASPAVERFLVVSCSIVYTKSNIFSIAYAKLNNAWNNRAFPYAFYHVYLPPFFVSPFPLFPRASTLPSSSGTRGFFELTYLSLPPLKISLNFKIAREIFSM